MAIYHKNGSMMTAAYNNAGQELAHAYNFAGDIVFEKTDYSSYSKTNYCTVNLSPTQGFDIYDGIIFQMIASASVSNKMATVNASNGTIIASNIAAVSDHGDSASFSDDFYDANDDYPLLYVTSDTNPAKVYVNRVTESTSQLIKTFSFPLEKTGYYAALCLDSKSNLAYMVGYSEQNYQTDGGGSNKTIISKWDLSQLTANQDGSYTPAFVSSVERAFIYVMQGQQFHDGMLWIASGGTNVRGYVYALDPNNGNLLYTVDTESTVEIEGISFISENEMVIGYQGGNYEMFTFQ